MCSGGISGHHRRSQGPYDVRLAVPIALIVVVTVVDILAPPEVHLGPFLVAAPAITASFAGPRTTGIIGALAVLAQTVVAVTRTSLTDLNHTLQVVALILISVLVAFLARLRERHEQQLTQLRSVAQAAQQVVLRPLPRRIGPLRLAAVYLAAEAEAQIGGDLYAAARTTGGTRFIIGDVRGKGLEAIGEAARLLGAFRAAAHWQPDLPTLVTYLEATVSSDLDTPGAWNTHAESDNEAFTTAAVLDIQDHSPTLTMINCGHPPPLLLRGGQVFELQVRQQAPPLGLTGFMTSAFTAEAFTFHTGDLVLLYTDGVIEARDRHGIFYPLTERVAAWSGHGPEALLRYMRDDLRKHAGGHLGDDAALVAIERVSHTVSHHPVPRNVGPPPSENR
ncbi:serine/threonine-protein phosphatase [Streptomyces sp. NBC_01142]|uniref:PP2C family protein-serine/threonine phosphatase n=1 Tax=Streptomyces sp. NBC_01142 TaxID=2975865 RepID=UPI00225A1125|nr:PP2C family protein-serine/threonine phosphatase [Streptomyces sp. NBC_01142]MCX4825778.1 serine/threonine-protein phosphatase [Streptomyces sp. NBC_01142]